MTAKYCITAKRRWSIKQNLLILLLHIRNSLHEKCFTITERYLASTAQNSTSHQLLWQKSDGRSPVKWRGWCNFPFCVGRRKFYTPFFTFHDWHAENMVRINSEQAVPSIASSSWFRDIHQMALPLYWPAQNARFCIFAQFGDKYNYGSV